MNSISIARVSSSKAVDYISIVLVTETESIEIKLTLEQYAMLITGRVVTDLEINPKSSELAKGTP